jgi:hypothetical protein
MTSDKRFIMLLVAIATYSPVVVSADITTGLLHHWAFDETSGSIGFDSVGSNNASLGGYQIDDPSWVSRTDWWGLAI